jgi:cobalamin biosynthesis protein CobT
MNPRQVRSALRKRGVAIQRARPLAQMRDLLRDSIERERRRRAEVERERAQLEKEQREEAGEEGEAGEVAGHERAAKRRRKTRQSVEEDETEGEEENESERESDEDEETREEEQDEASAVKEEARREKDTYPFDLKQSELAEALKQRYHRSHLRLLLSGAFIT